MSQPRRLSAVEATANVAVGGLVALATQVLVFPVIGLQVMLWQPLVQSTVFATVSFLRGHPLRRLFARLA